MLNAPKQKSYNESKVVSIIGAGTKIKGEIRSQGTIRLEGEVEGSVHSDDTIIVHDSGHIKADLIGGQVIISGEVHGNIAAHDRLEIMPQGRVFGDITAPRIAIAEGVVFEGKCTMKAPGQTQQPRPAQK